MTTKERNECKDGLYKRIKDMKKDEKLNWIELMIFQLDMIDRWSEVESTLYDVLIEIKKEIMEEKHYGIMD